MQETFISLVEIIFILIWLSDNTLNIVAATPEWLFIPIPTIDTFEIFSSDNISVTPASFPNFSHAALAYIRSVLGTVKEISVLPSSLATF